MCGGADAVHAIMPLWMIQADSKITSLNAKLQAPLPSDIGSPTDRVLSGDSLLHVIFMVQHHVNLSYAGEGAIGHHGDMRVAGARTDGGGRVLQLHVLVPH